jgi:hypothetical protein
MVMILLQETVAELDAKIAAATVALQLANDELNYMKQARALLAHPRAATITFHIKSEEEAKAPAYGGLKRSVFSCLSETEAKTPQSIVEIMQAQGYTFRSKTPAISVNEALQTLKNEGKAVLSGRSPSGANLWLSEKGVLAPEEDGQEEEETPAEAGA